MGASPDLTLCAFAVLSTIYILVKNFPLLIIWSTRPGVVWPKRSIVIYCPAWIPGQQAEWGPESTKTGLGGSEEAVVYLSREWVKKGYSVTVYNKCGRMAGVHDGVVYLPTSSFNLNDRFDQFILWRSPEPFCGRVNAFRKTYWTHDAPACMLWASVLSMSNVKDCATLFVTLSRNFGYKAALVYIVSTLVYWPRSVTVKMEASVALTKFHADCLRPIIPLQERRLKTIGNGVVPEQFDWGRPVQRDPYRLIYAMSYNRGLERLLRMWPRVRAAVPQATLHLYYGWGAIYNKQQLADLQQAVKQEGIFEHGRVGHIELLEEYRKAGIFAYPSSTPEAYSISTVKAMLCGCVPVLSALGALPSVAGAHKGPIVVSPHDDDEAYLEALLGVLRDIPDQERRRKAMLATAKPQMYAWSTIAQQWIDQVFTNDDLQGVLDDIPK